MTETLKPCPLAEALELTQVHFSSEENAEALRAELAKRGYAITRAPDDVAQIVAAHRQAGIAEGRRQMREEAALVVKKEMPDATRSAQSIAKTIRAMPIGDE